MCNGQTKTDWSEHFKGEQYFNNVSLVSDEISWSLNYLVQQMCNTYFTYRSHISPPSAQMHKCAMCYMSLFNGTSMAAFIFSSTHNASQSCQLAHHIDVIKSFIFVCHSLFMLTKDCLTIQRSFNYCILGVLRQTLLHYNETEYAQAEGGSVDVCQSAQ